MIESYSEHAIKKKDRVFAFKKKDRVFVPSLLISYLVLKLTLFFTLCFSNQPTWLTGENLNSVPEETNFIISLFGLGNLSDKI